MARGGWRPWQRPGAHRGAAAGVPSCARAERAADWTGGSNGLGFGEVGGEMGFLRRNGLQSTDGWLVDLWGR